METIQERSAIEKLIFCYRDAFNAANISETVASFTPDGINMPNNAPSSKGKEQLTASFEFLLKAFQINIQYVIDEIIVIGDYAYVRTNSKVNTIIRASNEHLSLENKELFVLRKHNGEWKISHYIFNNTKIIK
jgi:uncharacterized protein (TIGR02246 family)